MNADTERYDVAILGTGFGGGLLGTVLARHGVNVLMLDAGSHPRFAIGESTVRHTFRMMKIMAEKFDVPEIKQCASGENIRKYITSACGEKRNFGFVYHHEGRPHDPEESTQLVIPPFREGYEAHLFRQDIDPHLLYSAIRYGADVRTNTFISEVDFDDEAVHLTTRDGQKFQARYLIDASGFRSPLAQKLQLRDDPARLKTHSRTLFTHMVDVKPFDEVGGAQDAPEKWWNGTCHHLFDGGWLWVIPFNNHPDSTNPVVSVGLSLDPRKFPKPEEMSPHDEFFQFIERYPSMARQFEDAKVVRNWVSTPRLQYASKQTVGDRWVLLAHAAGNIDALFSRGLANTTEAANAIASILIPALKEDDLSAERFAYVEELQQNLIDYNDRLVYGAYVSFRDFDLWNAWFRIWALGVGVGDLRLAGIYRKYKRTHDESLLPQNEPPMGLFCSNHEGFKRIFDEALAVMEQVDAGTMATTEATRRILNLVRNADFTAPAVGLGNPDQRYINAGAPATLVRSAIWAFTQAPPEIKDHVVGATGNLKTLIQTRDRTRAMPTS